MLLLNAAALAIFAGTAVQAAMWNIEVGANGLIFNPPSIIAAPADIIVFTLYVVSPYPLSSTDLVSSISGAHTVTQSTFANPCTPIIGGVDSGPSVPFLYSLNTPQLTSPSSPQSASSAYQTIHFQLHRQRHRTSLVLLQDRPPLPKWNGLRHQPDREEDL